jgi:hypothetical protein
MEELGLKPQAKGALGVPVLKPTADGFECSIELNLPGSKLQRWQIRQDSLIRQATQP